MMNFYWTLLNYSQVTTPSIMVLVWGDGETGTGRMSVGVTLIRGAGTSARQQSFTVQYR